MCIRDRVYINATGVWTDEILEKLFGPSAKKMEPTKGVHLLIPSGPVSYTHLFRRDLHKNLE